MLPLSRNKIIATNDPLELLEFGRSVGQHLNSVRVFQKPEREWSCKFGCWILGTSYITSTETSAYSCDGASLDRVTAMHALRGHGRVTSGTLSKEIVHGAPVLFPENEITFHPSNKFTGLVHNVPRAELNAIIEKLELSVANDVLRFGSLQHRNFFMDRYSRSLQYLVELYDSSKSYVIDDCEFSARVHEFLLIAFAKSLACESLSNSCEKIDWITLKRARDYIEAHLTEQLRITSIADEVGCSVRKLLYLFRKTEGVSVVSYIRERRLSVARSRLLFATGGDSVTSIALSAGFSHLGEFSLKYREQFGETPSSTLDASTFRK